MSSARRSSQITRHLAGDGDVFSCLQALLKHLLPWCCLKGGAIQVLKDSMDRRYTRCMPLAQPYAARICGPQSCTIGAWRTGSARRRA